MALPPKQESLDALTELLGLEPMLVGDPGSSIPSELFYAIGRTFGIELNGQMPLMGEAIARAAGLDWPYSIDLPAAERCDSRETPSGGGSTVTRLGMVRLREAVEILLQRAASEQPAAPVPPGEAFGRRYVEAVGGIEAEPKILERDWEELDRATRSHARIQNDLADLLRSRGIEPASPRPSVDPAFDIGWMCTRGRVICEVKSSTMRNIVQQVRLGLGQVLEYRSIAMSQSDAAVTAVLLVEGEPSERQRRTCRSVDVVLASRVSLADDLAHLIDP